jgi:hypothetical protein
MGQLHHESRPDTIPSAPAPPPGAAPDAVVPQARGRWERVALATPARRAGAARPAATIVLRVSRGQGARSWTIDPGLVVVLAAALALFGLGALDRLLFAVLMRLL